MPGANAAQDTAVERIRDWTPVRKAFVERADRPTHQELSVEFGIPRSTIERAASSEGWPILRAQHFEHRLLESDCAVALLESGKADRSLIEKIRALCLVLVQDTLADIEELRGWSTPARRLSARQGATFGVLNISTALKNLGMGAMPKDFADRIANKADGSDWSRGVAIQVINNLVGAPAPAAGEKSVIETAEKSVR